jgi:hypothetical protein
MTVLFILLRGFGGACAFICACVCALTAFQDVRERRGREKETNKTTDKQKTTDTKI